MTTYQQVDRGRKAHIGAITSLGEYRSGFVLGYHECANCQQGYKVVVPLADLNEFGKKTGLGQSKVKRRKQLAVKLLQKFAE